MSRETQQWLDENVLVGHTNKRGTAWHYREGTDNHYPDAIPVADVKRRLFSWEPVEMVLACPCGCGNTHKAIHRSDNRHRMGIFKESYVPHGYDEWLLNQVSHLLGDTMSIGSAGLLKGGAIAWVSVEVPDNMATPEGVLFRPHLLATTSLDGSVATTYKRVITRVVCDNTRDMAMGENSQTVKVRHSKYSKLKLAEARDALDMVHTMAEDFQAEVAELTRVTVTDQQWFRFLDTYTPADGKDMTDRSKTMAKSKQERLTAMYRNDVRCAPWAGTAFGVLQTVDTYNQHESIVRNVSRAERNMSNLIKGVTLSDDQKALATLKLVLA